MKPLPTQQPPISSSLSRRRWLHVVGQTAIGLPLAPLLSWQQVFGQGAQGADRLEPLNRFPRMVHNHFVARVRKLHHDSLQEKSALQTQADAEAYVQSVRKKIRQCFGPEPERTPLKSRVTGIVERDTYRIEKVIFESRPNFPVTANLYVPAGRTLPLPGVVGTCGHSPSGKADKSYQSFAQGLARLGYVCLIYDPIGQGERLQYVDEDGADKFRGPVHQHNHIGNQQLLVGEFFGMWRAWDGIRALDYLLSRDEVDPNHVGVTGNSGGGTMTTWLAALDPRWTMAAPSCFVTTFGRNMENELPADSEQCPPKALALGLDHEDFIAAMAPKPVILLAKEQDFFDVRGTEEAYQRLKRLYTLLGAKENIAMFVGPTTHGFSQENREAMYGWFNRATGVSDVQTEPELKLEEEKTLWCTSGGQISELNPRTVFDFTQEKSQLLANARGTVEPDNLLPLVREVLQLLPPTEKTPPYQILRNFSNRNYPRPHAVTYAVQTEPDIWALVYRLANQRRFSRPPRAGKKAILYVSHHSADQELRSDEWLRELIEASPDEASPDMPCFACDIRGIGESKADTCEDSSFESFYGSDYFYAAHSLMLDHPYVGQKTWDVLRVLDWLKSFGHTDVHLIAKGWGTLPATFAALFSELTTQVTLREALTSYQDIAESEYYDWPLSTLLPNGLAHFDLPDCYRALRGKLTLRLL
ncbi:MAG: prolyl oligopeptidase family serine peptidase [Planctomycetes bacterium]|nr:prolyl oligopeptidase family serine peptidase [Planctomycetota bacterium]